MGLGITLVGIACATVMFVCPASDMKGGEKEHVSRVKASKLNWEPSLLVQLRVSDLDRSIAFYRDVLDFDLVLRNDALLWAKFDTGIRNLRVGIGVGEKVEGSGTTSLNFGVKDIDSARSILESRGVVFKGPTMTIPNVVKLADFTDPDGTRIRLAEDLEK